MVRKRIGCVMRTPRSHDDWQRLGPDLREINLPGRADGEGQPFDRRRELRVDVATITARIDPLPPRIRQPHAVQPVEAERCSAAIEAEALVAESCGQAVGAQERGQKVTLRVAESASLQKHL